MIRRKGIGDNWEEGDWCWWGMKVGVGAGVKELQQLRATAATRSPATHASYGRKRASLENG